MSDVIRKTPFVSSHLSSPLIDHPIHPINNDFYRDLLDHVPGMVQQFWLEPDGTMHCTYVNPGCAALFDCAPTALLQDATLLLTAMLPGDRESFQQALVLAAQIAEPWQWEGYIQTQGGASTKSPRRAIATFYPQSQSEGPILWYGVWMGVVPGAVEVQQLPGGGHSSQIPIANMAQRDFIFEISQDLLCVAGFDGYFKQINSQWQQVLGYSEAELLAKPWIDLVHPDDRDITHQQGIALFNGTTLRSFENRYLSKDGTVRWLLWQCVPMLEQGLIFGSAKDITAHKKAEAELQQTKNFLESILNALPVGVAAKDAQDLRFVLWNPAIAELLEMPAEEILGKTDYDFFPTEQADQFTKIDRTVLATGQVLDIPEEEACTLSGEIRILHTKKTAVLDHNGQPRYLVAITEDITDRKRAEARLAEQQRTLRAILDTAPIWIWMTNCQGQMQFINRTFCENVGIPEEQFLAAAHYREVIGEAAAQNCMASDAACYAQDTVHTSEELLPFVDGHLHAVEVLKAKVRDERGAVVGLIGLGVDATERKQAEVALQNYADRQTLLNQLTTQIRHSLDQDIIIDTALKAIHTRLQLDFCGLVWFHPELEPPVWENVKSVMVTGFKNPSPKTNLKTTVGPVDEWFLTQGVLKIDQVEGYAEPIHRAFLQNMGVAATVEVPIFLQGGRLGALIGSRLTAHAWTEYEVELLQAVASQLAIALNQSQLYLESRQQAHELAQTLAELQRTQMQMIQSEKMSSLGQLVAGVAHEINNPVNFIYGNLSHANDYISDLLGLISLYQEHYPQPVTAIAEEVEAIDLEFLQEDLLKLLKSMRVGAERIQAIVASLRTFSRMDEAERKQIDIHEGIDSTLMILQHRTKARHDRPEIRVLKEYGDLPAVECYAGQLNQVFMNILVNAIDALDEQVEKSDGTFEPTITIQTTPVSPTLIQIAIADNGTGIPAAVKARIFDPFYTTKAVGKGTGMGMSISHQIITERHNGTLTCLSTPGQGTQFLIQIPIQ